jgi:hypothetical protein
MIAPRNLRRTALLWGALGVLASTGTAHAQATVALGGAQGFGVLAGEAVSNTGPTVVNGDLGIYPGTSLGGFPPGVVNGTVDTAGPAAAQAQLDAGVAYADTAGRPATDVLPTQLGGSTLPPGVYVSNSGGFKVGGTLTLDAQRDGHATFIFKVATALDVPTAGSRIELIESAQACNVFWQVAGDATLGAGTSFVGSILALGDITAGPGAAVDGRLLSRSGSVALSSGTVTAPLCDRVKPRLKISRVPRGCAGNFRSRFTVSDDIGITTAVYLDGRRLKRSSKPWFTARIGAKGLRAGRHTLRAVARDDAGNRRARVARFRRC